MDKVAEACSPSLTEDEQRKQELRKAGKDYLERALSRASKGKDPFVQQPVAGKTERIALRRKGFSEDPDLAAFGAIFEGTLLYVLVGLYIAAQASTLVFLKGCLLSMATPATLTFLHMLPVALAVWMMGSYEMVQPPEMTMRAVKGCSARVVLHALQMLLMVCALYHSSVYMVLSWTCAVPLLVEVLAGAQLQGDAPADALKVPLGVALCGALLELLFDAKRSLLGLALLLLWTAAKCGEHMWQWLKEDATAGGFITDLSLCSAIREVAALEGEQGRSTQALMAHALPAAPVLLLGFLFLEGQELVDHELSVPAVTVMLLSCLAFTLAAATQLLLAERLAPEAKLLARGLSLAGTVLLDFLERAHALGTMCLLGACLAVAGSVAAGWVQRQQRAQPADGNAQSRVSGSGRESAVDSSSV